jgi:hypothetical protein
MSRPWLKMITPSFYGGQTIREAVRNARALGYYEYNAAPFIYSQRTGILVAYTLIEALTLYKKYYKPKWGFKCLKSLLGMI